MNYYPVFIDVRDQPCLVVGGGAVGARKAATLLECGARITVIDPSPAQRLQQLAGQDQLRLIRRPYTTSDLQDVLLVFAATDDNDLNRRIGRDARRCGLLCNVATHPEIGSFILPSVMRRGDLIVAISTQGGSPALAKRLRRQLEEQFGDEYAVFLGLMKAVRKRLLAQGHAPGLHKAQFEQLLDSDLITLIENRRWEAIDRILYRILGAGFSFEDLIQSEAG
jgi:precorrin-2 dehydrogenase/sirohydrochlorin ferrochelatase